MFLSKIYSGKLFFLIELYVLLSEEGVDGIVEPLGLLAGEGSLRMGAGEGVLAEDRLVAAEEGVLLRLDDLPGIVLEGHADVEDSAVVSNVGIVSVGSALAVKGGVGLASQDVKVAVGEDVAVEYVLASDDAGKGKHCEGGVFHVELYGSYD